MSLLTKDQILAANDQLTKDVEVPEWGGVVRIRTMSASERDKWESETYADGKVNTLDFRARFCALCIVDEQGARLFTDAEVSTLGRKSAAALQRVFNAAQELNALSNKDVKELEGNSGAAPEGGNSSN